MTYLDRRVARLEATAPDPAGDLRRLVLRAFSGDDRAMGRIGPRLRAAMGLTERDPFAPLVLDPGAVARNDPDLHAAIATVPAEVTAGLIRDAEARFGVPIAELVERHLARC